MNFLDVKLPPYFFSPFVFHNTKRCTLTSRRWLRLRTRSLRLLPILHLFRGRASRSSVFRLPHQILDASVTSHSFVSLPPKYVLYLRLAPRRLGVSSTIQRSSDSSLLLVFSRTTVLRHEARSLGSVSSSAEDRCSLFFFSKYKITVAHLKGAPWGGFS